MTLVQLIAALLVQGALNYRVEVANYIGKFIWSEEFNTLNTST